MTLNIKIPWRLLGLKPFCVRGDRLRTLGVTAFLGDGELCPTLSFICLGVAYLWFKGERDFLRVVDCTLLDSAGDFLTALLGVSLPSTAGVIVFLAGVILPLAKVPLAFVATNWGTTMEVSSSSHSGLKCRIFCGFC